MPFKYFGLLAFGILVVGLLFIVWRWPQGKHLTFSQHVAVARHRIIYYIVLFAVSLPLLLLFFAQWFTPTFQMPGWFTASLFVAALAQQACTLIPEIPGWRVRYHQLLAGISAAFLFPPLIAMLLSPHIPHTGRWLSALSLIGMLSIIVTLLLRRGSGHYLLLQAGYYAAFFAPVLFVAYLT